MTFCFFVVLLALGLSYVAADCSQVQTCNEVVPGCGWCWDLNGQYGGLAGNTLGPFEGFCSDWVYNSTECHKHVDCAALPDCLNILGTNVCGWCETTQSAARGTILGPDIGTCEKWIFDFLACPTNYSPQQVHIAFGETPNTIVVAWASEREGDSSVIYSVAGSSTSQSVVASTRHYGGVFNSNGCHYIHNAVLNDLQSSTNYVYRVQTGGNFSQEFSFLTVPDQTTQNDDVYHYLVYGDMGRHGGGFILPFVDNEVAENNITAIIHVGDFAYNLVDAFGINGDTFLNRVQSIASSVPYMTCPGNHEEDLTTFSNYLNRFFMPRFELGAEMMWHSYNVGKVHFISFSTEVYFFDTWHKDAQYQWLVQDLAQANKNREAQPWVIAYGHRPMYCSNNDGDCPYDMPVRLALEQLFYEAGVDIIIEAHEHSYERLYPVYNYTVTQYNYTNPMAPVHLVTGAAGCNENDGACINPIPGPAGPWSAFQSSAEGTYSFCHMSVYNETHIYWDSFVAEERRVEDAIWIVQSSHGPRV